MTPVTIMQRSAPPGRNPMSWFSDLKQRAPVADRLWTDRPRPATLPATATELQSRETPLYETTLIESFARLETLQLRYQPNQRATILTTPYPFFPKRTPITSDRLTRSPAMTAYARAYTPEPVQLPSPFGPGGVPDITGHRAWYGNYVGPGNTRADWEQDHLQPLTPVDRAAEEHDKAYDKIAQKYGFSEGWDPQTRKYRKEDEYFDIITERVDIQRPMMHIEIIGADLDLIWRSWWNMTSGVFTGQYAGGIRGIDELLADMLAASAVTVVFTTLILIDATFFVISLAYKTTIWALSILGLQPAMDAATAGLHHAGGVLSQAVHHAGGVLADTAHHAGGVFSQAVHRFGGEVSTGWKHAGGQLSSAWKHAGSVLSGGWEQHATSQVSSGLKQVGDVVSEPF